MTVEQMRARVQRRFMAMLGISGAAERAWTRLNAATTAAEGEVLLYGPIVDDLEAECFNELTEYDTMASANVFRAALAEVEGDVTVRINSPGGSWFEASAIHAALSERSGKVSVVVDGLAASAAGLVMLAGDEVRIAAMGAIMVHKAWAVQIGNADDYRAAAEEMDRFDEAQAGLLAARMDADARDVLALLKAETWYTADEAVEAGLADGKIEKKTKPAKKAATNAARNARFRALLAMEA